MDRHCSVMERMVPGLSKLSVAGGGDDSGVN